MAHVRYCCLIKTLDQLILCYFEPEISTVRTKSCSDLCYFKLSILKYPTVLTECLKIIINNYYNRKRAAENRLL